MRPALRRVIAIAAAAIVLVPAAGAAAQDLCLDADPPPITSPAKPLRFGITPQLAGTAGSTQGEALPEDRAAALAALQRLPKPKAPFVIRLNRLFMSDRGAGIRRFVRLARRFSRAGFHVESQVRYHPAREQEGDMRAWRRFVRRAAKRLGANRDLVALTITNEVNLPISSNTSDGAYARALDAIVYGTVAAHRTLARSGRRDVRLGFSYAYRYLPTSDVEFWRGIGARATPRFKRALDYVGVQLYPGLFWPPLLLPGQSAGDATVEGLELVRSCYMPLAKLGRETDLWVTENGYATNLGRNEAGQARNLASTLESVHAYSGTLNVTDFRYFNLRDNRPGGTDLFDNVGLLRADYSRKPAFSTFREGVRTLGRD